MDKFEEQILNAFLGELLSKSPSDDLSRRILRAANLDPANLDPADLDTNSQNIPNEGPGRPSPSTSAGSRMPSGTKRPAAETNVDSKVARPGSKRGDARIDGESGDAPRSGATKTARDRFKYLSPNGDVLVDPPPTSDLPAIQTGADADGLVASPPEGGDYATLASPTGSSSPSSSRALSWVISLAAVLMVGVTVGLVMLIFNVLNQITNPELADNGPAQPNTGPSGQPVAPEVPGVGGGSLAGDSDTAGGRRGSETLNRPDADGTGRPSLAGNDLSADSERSGERAGPPSQPPGNAGDYPVLAAGEVVWPPAFTGSDHSAATTTVAQLKDSIDQYIEREWDLRGLQPSPGLTDEAWLVRTTNRLLGATPTASELTRLRAKLAAEGRAAVVNCLISEEEYRSRFVDHWADSLAKRLVGLHPDLPVENEPQFGNLRSYLKSALESKTPWDQVAYELLSAVGTLQPGHPEFNPATGFLTFIAQRMGNRREYWTSHVTQTFMGQNSRCSQCHASMDGLMAQQDFYELHAYFAQTRFEELEDGAIRLVNRDFLPRGRMSLDRAPVEFQRDAGDPGSAFPKPLDNRHREIGDSIQSGLVKVFDRRTMLAQQVAESPEWRRALVNHVWAAMLNCPLTTSVPDSETDTPIYQLHAELATGVAESNYTLESLIQAIALSEPFDRGLGTGDNLLKDSPFLEHTAAFSRYYDLHMSRRTSLEALAIVHQAYREKTIEGLVRMRGVLAQRIGQPENARPEIVRIREGLPEKQAAWAQSARNSEVLQRIADDRELSPSDKIEHLIAAAFRRPPRDSEIEQGLAILRTADDDTEALQDIWWALQNSFEFVVPVSIR